MSNSYTHSFVCSPVQLKAGVSYTLDWKTGVVYRVDTGEVVGSPDSPGESVPSLPSASVFDRDGNRIGAVNEDGIIDVQPVKDHRTI